MASRKDIIGKYCSSDIFNLKPKSSMVELKPKFTLNRSSLENTKEDLFNIGKEKRINRYQNKEIYKGNSAEKRKNNYEKIYGSDIFNLRAKSVERRNGRHHMPSIANKSTCFEEMKNDEEYVKDVKEYTKEKRGNCNKVKEIQKAFDNNINEEQLQYIKKRRPKIENEKNNKIVSRNEYNNELNFKRNHPFTLYSNERRKFIDLDECRVNNCKINKQIQFESNLFSNEENKYSKTKEDIKEINTRINRGKYTPNNYNILGQPIIRVNRKKTKYDNIHSSMDNIHKKLGPANITWDSLQSQVMFSPDYTKNLYKNYGPKGPTAYQRRLHQFADSDNLDTLSGLQNNYGNNLKSLKKPMPEEIKNKEEQKKIIKVLDNIPNLSEGQKLEIKMNSSILDYRDEKEWNNKTKDLNDFLKKEKKKKNEVTDKVNHITNKNKNLLSNKNNKINNESHDYTIKYGIKGSNLGNYNENEIKNIFGQKGINVYDIHKNNFEKGNKYNTIDLKIIGNNDNNELNKKLKLIQDELAKKNNKVKIEKGKKTNNFKNFVNNPGGKIVIMKDNISNKKEENKYKLMPNEYKVKKGFTKQFAGINYAYKNPNLLFC